MAPRNKQSYFVLRLESYEGHDTFLSCGNDTQDYLYCIVAEDEGRMAIVDNGYRSVQEAMGTWPEARPDEPVENMDRD